MKYIELGGEHVQLIESLNDGPRFIEALEGIIRYFIFVN
jgi:hypothetical protein